MMNVEEQEISAEKIQKIHSELLNGSSFDVIPKENLSCVKEILSYYFPESAAEELSVKFYQRQTDLKFRIILVNCVTNDVAEITAVVRVLERERAVFYDASCRKYTEWDDFLSSNLLPKCLMIYPKNGTYQKEGECVLLEKRKSPAKGTLRQLDKVLSVGASCVSLIALFLPAFSFSKTFATPLKVACGVSNGYKIGRHTYQLYDLHTHGHSINFADQRAAHHWSHIGNGFLTFAVTWLRNEYGKTIESSSTTEIMNTLVVFKSLLLNLSPESINIVKNQILYQCLLDFSKIEKSSLTKVCNLFSDQTEHISKIFDNLRQFLDPNSNKVFRRLLSVNDEDLIKVAQDLKTELTVPQNINNKIYEILCIHDDVVACIMREVHAWKNGDITDQQLKFRVTEICHGEKKYETIAEMCEYYKVDSVDQIVVNGVRVFSNLGSVHSEMKNLFESMDNKYPQLLWYAVAYATEQGPAIDWNNFKLYFDRRINEEALNEISFPGRRIGIHWIYTLNKKEIKFSFPCTENTTDFVSPKNPSQCSVSVQDLVILSKRLLGTLAEFDVSVARDQLDWVVVVSKQKKKVVILGPSVLLECPMPTPAYPLWIRPL